VQIVEPIVVEFGADMTVVSCGFDACHGHSNALGGYELTPEIFAHSTQRLMTTGASERCVATTELVYACRLVLALEGGYHLPMMAECGEQVVRALCRQSPKGLPHTSLHSKAQQVRTLKLALTIRRPSTRCTR